MTELALRPATVRTGLDFAFEGFMLSREAMRCTAKTLEHYQYTLGSFTDYLADQDVHDVAEITPHDIRAYLVGLQRRGLKDTTQHIHARGIRAWLNWLVDEGELDTSPMRRVAMPRLEKRIPPPFSPQEVQTLLAACDQRTVLGARNYAIILTLLDTGLRAAEFCSLHVGDLDMRSGLCTVLGKGSKQRTVRVGARARGAIVKMLAMRGDVTPDEPLWAGRTGQGIAIHGLQTMLHRLGRRVGVMPCAPHRLRRTFALWCLRDGMDLHSLRMLMGHSTLDVLQRYLALAGEDVERAHKAHSPADKLLDMG
jgi:site-specific recombinase XerD